MAGDWNTLGDPSQFQGLPFPASPITASGEDPDEVRERLAAQAQMGNGHAGSVVPGTPTATPVQQVQPKLPNVESPGFNADTARQSMTGQLASGRDLTRTADQMQPDPQIAELEQKKMQDEAATPNAANYKPGFGTRLLRGLKGAGLGLAEGGIFGMGVGAIDPGLVRGGTSYGDPTDAYDAALNKNKQLVAQDTESLSNAQANFKQAQELREKQLGGYKDSGEAFRGAGTTATTQEENETKGAQLPIDQEKADTERDKANNVPEPKTYEEMVLRAQTEKDPQKRAQYWKAATDIQKAEVRRFQAGANANGPVDIGNTKLSGDAYLQTLPAGMGPTIKAIAEGRMAPPSPGNRSKQAQALLNALNIYAPGYDATKYPTYAATRKEFTEGKIGQSINSFNTSLNHLDRLEQNIPDNGYFETLNALRNAASPSGSERSQKLAAFDADATAVANEVSKAYKGGVISEGEYNHMNSLLSRSAAPAKMKANIAEFRELLQGKLENFQKQWESGMPPGAVSPLQTIQGSVTGTGGGGGGSSSGAGDDWFKQHPEAN